jgi:hypothetical protein
MPVPQLLPEILFIVKPADLEERRLYEQVLDTAFLLGSIRPAQLYAYAHLQRGVAKHQIPFRDLAVFLPLQSDGLRSIKHTQQWAAAPAGQVLGKGPH